MVKLVLEKFKESLLSVLPITAIVIILNFFIPLNTWDFIGFIIGAVMLIVGMTLFTLGADMSMMNVGSGVGKYITKKRKIWIAIVIPLIIGVLITVAEPDLIVLAGQVSITDEILIYTVSLGVGIFLVIAILRVILKLDLRYILLICYTLVFILAFFSRSSFVPIAFDSGGVTTGPMTVPFIMAIGIGVASMSSKNSKDDSFGYVALCSVGPILVVMLLGLFLDIDVAQDNTTHLVTNLGEFWPYFKLNFDATIVQILKALAPFLAFALVFELIIIKDSHKNIVKIFVGLIYTFIGLVLFLAGAHIGFMPIGGQIGTIFASSEMNWVLIPLGMLMGFFVVMAEPAVHVLNNQVEEVTGGSISKKTMLFSLAIGVAISIGLAMARVVFDFTIWWVIIPGYAIALGLTLIVPKIFSSIAFDSGGVASGPMTATFLLPMATGACFALYANEPEKILQNGFGIVSLVAMTPLIVIQLLGLVYKIKLHRTKRTIVYPYEDVIEFTTNINMNEEGQYE